jgi:hypothetical protein
MYVCVFPRRQKLSRVSDPAIVRESRSVPGENGVYGTYVSSSRSGSLGGGEVT